nr:MAG TPA: hypothetical protein [Caudoviricetes sp.]
MLYISLSSLSITIITKKGRKINQYLFHFILVKISSWRA